MTKLFVSYRSLDSIKVDVLVTRLRSCKNDNDSFLYHVWQDKRDIPDGQDWWDSIIDAIIGCDVFIFMISRESINNLHCLAELNYARKRNRPVIGVVLEDEFFHNSQTGKNSIEYWNDMPQELNDLRSQLLFYEGANFLPRLANSIAYFKQQPQRWRDISADRPRDPRYTSDETNSAVSLYKEACNYAWRLQIETAERLFQKLMNIDDPDFSEEAYQWIQVLRKYQKLLLYDDDISTRHKVQQAWETYMSGFPKNLPKLFDPKDFKSRYRQQNGFEPTPLALESSPRRLDTIPEGNINSKWADYVIIAVHYDPFYGFIELLRLYEHTGDTLHNMQDRSRDWVIDQLNHGKTFVTAVKSNGQSQRGAKVELVKINTQTYIRTDSNHTAMDNLGNLPKF